MSTVTVLQLQKDFWDKLGELYEGTATGGGANYLTDTGLLNLASDTFPTPIKGRQLRLTAGAANNDVRQVTKVDETEPNLFVNRAFTGSPVTSDTYFLCGTSIALGGPLRALFNTALRDRRPITATQQTIVTSQRWYDVTTLVRTRDDILAVYVRDLDAANLEPYQRRDVEFWAEDRGGAGTTSVWIKISPLTLNTATTQLWIEHRTAFSAFSADTDTVDAVYRDWLAAEALLLHANRMLLRTNADRARWGEVRDQMRLEVASWRDTFENPHQPVLLRAVGPLV